MIRKRYWIKTVYVPFDEFEVGCYHDAPCRYERPAPIPEDDDYCEACEDEHYDCSDKVIGKLDKAGFDVHDIMLVNRPGLASDEDRFWQWKVEVSRES